MKMVVAVIKPYKLEEVRENLTELGIEGMTATEVKGYGRQNGYTELLRDDGSTVSYQPKVRIEIAIPTEMEDKVVKSIQESAYTGRIGDGKIFVYDLSRVIRIRTGDNDKDAV